MSGNRVRNFFFPPRRPKQYVEEVVLRDNPNDQHTAWLYHDPGYYMLYVLGVFAKPENLNCLISLTVHKNHRDFPIPDIIKWRIPKNRLPLECNTLNQYQRARIQQFYAELDTLIAAVREPDTVYIARIHMLKLYSAAETAANELYAL